MLERRCLAEEASACADKKGAYAYGIRKCKLSRISARVQTRDIHSCTVSHLRAIRGEAIQDADSLPSCCPMRALVWASRGRLVISASAKGVRV